MEKVILDSPQRFPSTFSMQKSRLIVGRKSVIRMLVAFGLVVLVPSLYAQQNKAGSDSPQAAWSNIQQFVKDMETAVQSKNLHGIHEPSMKIRAPIKTLKQHSSMLSGDKGQKIGAALKQLDTSVTDLHSASDEGNQADAETALKAVESALDQLKAQDLKRLSKVCIDPPVLIGSGRLRTESGGLRPFVLRKKSMWAKNGRSVYDLVGKSRNF